MGNLFQGLRLDGLSSDTQRIPKGCVTVKSKQNARAKPRVRRYGCAHTQVRPRARSGSPAQTHQPEKPRAFWQARRDCHTGIRKPPPFGEGIFGWRIFYYAFQFAVSAVWITKAIQPNAPIFTRTSNMWFLLSSRYIYILPRGCIKVKQTYP